MNRSSLLLLIALTLACESEQPCSTPETGSDSSDATGAETGSGEPACPGVSAEWPGLLPIDCPPTFCWLDGTRLECDAAWYLAPTHLGDFILRDGAIDLNWNELPHNAEAGPWEDAEYHGGAEPSCGHFGVDIATLVPSIEGNRTIVLLCRDITAGVMAEHRVVVDEGDGITLY